MLTSDFLTSETTAAESGLYRARDPARTCREAENKLDAITVDVESFQCSVVDAIFNLAMSCSPILLF